MFRVIFIQDYFVNGLLFYLLYLKNIILNTSFCKNFIFFRYSLFVIPLIGFSQCPDFNATFEELNSQAEVDAFAVNYSDCTDFFQLVISGEDITDLSTLSGLSYISQLVIYNNSSLISLTGLEGLTDVDVLNISNNDLLVDLTGLNNLVNSGDDITISGNDNLINLNGLDSLNNFGPAEISYNSSLQSLDGINMLTQIYSLLLSYNNSLTDISALNDVDFLDEGFIEGLVFRNNQNLSICNISSVCNSLNYCNMNPFYCPLGQIIIENNAPGCNSIPEVSLSCDLVPSNDSCEEALELTIGETLQAYNENATASTQTPSCNDINRVDIWFTVNSSSYSTLDILAEPGYSLQLWEGNCTNLTQVANACAANTLTDISVSTNTDYYVQVWSDSNGKRATGLFDVLVQDGTLTTPEFGFEGFSIFPNPVNELLHFKSGTRIESVVIYNLIGQQILESKPNSMQTVIDTSNLQAGMYLVTVTIGKQVKAYKIAKE